MLRKDKFVFLIIIQNLQQMCVKAFDGQQCLYVKFKKKRDEA
jgi:hypothetical protein